MVDVGSTVWLMGRVGGFLNSEYVTEIKIHETLRM